MSTVFAEVQEMMNTTALLGVFASFQALKHAYYRRNDDDQRADTVDVQAAGVPFIVLLDANRQLGSGHVGR